MGDYGAKISQTGISVETATDRQSIFSSKFSTLKILGQGDTSFTTDGSGNGSVSVSHGLNYAPAHYVFCKGTANFSFLDSSSYTNAFAPLTQSGSNWISGINNISAYTTTSNLVISASGASANTTYNFRYYYFVDLAQSFSSSSGLTLSNAFGLKVSKPGYDVKTAQEYQMIYSQKYKSLQYYDVLYGTSSISLPLAYADPEQSTVETGSYVDVIHNLGYQPFFFAWGYNFPLTGSISNQNIYAPQQSGRGVQAANQTGFAMIDGFCDATRIRLSFYEKSGITANNVNGPKYPATTITFKWVIFTENLTA